MNKFMKMAINEAEKGIFNNEGGPFGCVIVKDGKIVGKGRNQVLLKHDATCHGEMQAIRDASKALKDFNLAGCELYTTGEPCHMCLSAIIWSNIDKVFYGCTIKDNALIGFRDEYINNLFGRNKLEKGFLNCVDRDACLKLFDKYKNLDHKTIY